MGFTSSEFDSRLEPGSGKNMKQSTLQKLNKAREIYNDKMSITSGYRVEADYIRLKKLGYQVAKNSAHFKGYAVDIRPTAGLTALADIQGRLSVEERNKRRVAELAKWKRFFQSLWDAGFRRFGIMRNTIHVDDDPSKVNNIMWRYNNTDITTYKHLQLWFNENLKKEKEAALKTIK